MGRKSSKRRQVKIYLSEEQYDVLKKKADELGITVPAFVKNIVLESIGELRGSSVFTHLRELEEKYNQLASEVGRMEQRLAVLTKKMKTKTA